SKMKEPLLRKGHNCWRISQVEKLALLFDGENYYKALFDVLPKSKSSIVVAGWEVDSRVGLQNVSPDYPKDLRSFFTKLVKNKHLHVFILSWRPALYLKFDRELFAKFRWWNNTNSKVHYWQDKTPFTFSSYHEKICLVDGSCAFLGGMDLTKRRWDTQSHKFDSQERIDGDGQSYQPVHDVQLVLSGKINDDIREFLQERLSLKSDKKVESNGSKIWPSTHQPTLTNSTVALSRTDPKKMAWEIEAFYIDALKRAKNYIFIENQYLSHEEITNILGDKLKELDGPDVIIVLPLSYPGFFERAIFIKERNKILTKLKKKDAFNRLLIVYPEDIHKKKNEFIVVHSKLMAIDDMFFTLGSANLNHRSLRVDNELNLCMEASNNNEREFIRDAVSELLAEHLAVKKEMLKADWTESVSLKKLVEGFQKSNGKTLVALPCTENTTSEKLFQWLLPFVDIKFALPKSYFNLGILLSLALLVFAARFLYEI
ncbi:MAG: hypothetical protein KC478_16805, partial [Bacteriovoracaceae bacterium]|nr:hypothetical protein [Bacteriovoracaceae bacterium]